jgi:DNA mismatch repair protein MutS
MAAFEIDQQTLNDLDIFSRENGETSIFSYFNYSKTVGGRKALKEMIITPSNDFAFLEARQSSIKYLIQKKVNLNLVNFELEYIEDYYYLSIVQLEMQRMFGIVNDSYKIQSGIRHLSIYLKKLYDLSESFKKEDCPQYLFNKIGIIKAALEKPVIAKVLSLNTDKEITCFEIKRLDLILRRDEKDTVTALLDIGYEFDAYQSIGISYNSHNLCFPILSGDPCNDVCIEGLFHPNIKNPVKNNIDVDNSSNLFFLTGVNMSGKSSFLKALGLAIYLAHVGFPVPAKSMSTKIFNGLITTLNLSDNINCGYSHYFSEVARVKKSATAILEKKKIFVIYDELFRGTNVKDAFEASLLIISALSRIKYGVFFISSHILELPQQLKVYKNISFKCFESEIINNQIVFNYRITNGISTNGIGMYIVMKEGIVEILEKASVN